MVSQKFKLLPRQFQVYSYLYSGFTVEQISFKLGISVSTVYKHLNRICSLFNLHSISSTCNYLENSGYLAFNPLQIYLSWLRLYLSTLPPKTFLSSIKVNFLSSKLSSDSGFLKLTFRI
ncbi:MAG: hypothetical protein F6K48_33085 [Okeania sp. SIO3H1]|nr:hypothetical protein [Okeania sp. SIO3H1]